MLPFACDLEVRISCAPNPAGIELTSDVDGWQHHVDGVARALREAGHEVAGVRGRISSTIPVGAGLSSSTALEVAIALALTGGAPVAPEVLQRAEQLATGVPCGLMDQTAILRARAGHALLLDCTDASVEHVPIPSAFGFVVVDTGTRRSLSDGRYAQRRAEVEAELEGRSLRELAWAPDLPPRLRHAVGELDRVRRAVEALRLEDLAALGEILEDSHASLRDDYEVSSEPLDVAVEILGAHEACAGARLVGAGFAGCVLGLVEAGAESRVAAWTDERLAGSRAFPVHAADAAGQVLV